MRRADRPASMDQRREAGLQRASEGPRARYSSRYGATGQGRPGSPTTRRVCSISTNRSASAITGASSSSQTADTQTVVMILFLGKEDEEVFQFLLADELRKVVEVAIDHAGGPAADHVEADDFAGGPPAMRLEHLAEADRQGQALPARGVLQSLVQLPAIEFGRAAHVQPVPGMSHGPGLGVIGGKIGDMELYPPVAQRDALAGRRGNRGVWADRGRAKAVLLALGGTRAADDVQKGFQPRLHAGVGGVGVDLQRQIGLRAQPGRKQGVDEGVDRAAEIADVEQEQIVVPAHQLDRIYHHIGEVPGRRAAVELGQAVARDHARRPCCGAFGRPTARPPGGTRCSCGPPGLPSAWRPLSPRPEPLRPDGASPAGSGPAPRPPAARRPRPRAGKCPSGRRPFRWLPCRPGIAPGEVQQRREKIHSRKGLRDEVRTGLGHGAEIRIAAPLGIGHAIDVRQEDRRHPAMDQVQHGPMGDLNRKTKRRLGLQPSGRVHAGQDHLETQPLEEVGVQGIERMHGQGPRDADGARALVERASCPLTGPGRMPRLPAARAERT